MKKVKVSKKTKIKIQKLGQASSASVLKATGRNWDQWIDILKTNGAENLTHKEIVRILKKKYKLNLWWQQWVTTGFEIHIGRRIEGQNFKGEYSMTATRTLSVSQKVVWRYLVSPEGLAAWLKPMSDLEFTPKNTFEVEGGIFGEIRTMKSPLRARFTWQDTDWDKPTYVQVYVIPRPKDKCMLVFNHDGLKSAALKAIMRTHWKKATDDLIAGLAVAGKSKSK